MNLPHLRGSFFPLIPSHSLSFPLTCCLQEEAERLPRKSKKKSFPALTLHATSHPQAQEKVFPFCMHFQNSTNIQSHIHSNRFIHKNVGIEETCMNTFIHPCTHTHTLAHTHRQRQTLSYTKHIILSFSSLFHFFFKSGGKNT